MAQRKNEEPADTLEELASLGERAAQWVGANPGIVLGAAALILMVAAMLGGWRAYSTSRSERASAALSTVRGELVVAMGGKPTDSEIPEPANPETARSVRSDFADRYLALADDWKGTPTGSLALLEAGGLLEELGNRDRALEVWTQAAATMPSGSPALGILHSRIAVAHEERGDFEAAARSHEAAAAVPGYPLVGGSLSAAARCWIEASKPDQALAVSRRLKSELPEYKLSPYIEASIAEIESRTGAPAAPVAPPAAPANP